MALKVPEVAMWCTICQSAQYAKCAVQFAKCAVQLAKCATQFQNGALCNLQISDVNLTLTLTLTRTLNSNLTLNLTVAKLRSIFSKLCTHKMSTTAIPESLVCGCLYVNGSIFDC